MWDPPGSGIKPTSPALAGGRFTTEPWGKPWVISFAAQLMESKFSHKRWNPWPAQWKQGVLSTELPGKSPWVIFIAISWPVPDLFSICFLRSACLPFQILCTNSPSQWTLVSLAPLIIQFPAILGENLTQSCPCSWGSDTLGKHPCWIPQALRKEIRKGDREFSLNPHQLSLGLVQRKMLSDWMIYWIKREGKIKFDRCSIGLGLPQILLTIQVDWLSLNRESFMETLWHISQVI